MGLPAICGLAEKYDRIFLGMNNRRIQEIADFPENVVDVLSKEPEFSLREMPVYVIGIAAAIEYTFFQSMLSTIRCVFRLVGLPIPDETPRPRIKEYSGPPVPSYDVILAPFTSADERTLTVDQVKNLCNRIPGSIGILGGDDNPEILSLKSIYHRPFDEAAQYLRQAKVVVAVDSFGGRLAHAAGVKNHIVVNSGATPVQCQTYPGATVMPREDVDAIANKVLELLG